MDSDPNAPRRSEPIRTEPSLSREDPFSAPPATDMFGRPVGDDGNLLGKVRAEDLMDPPTTVSPPSGFPEPSTTVSPPPGFQEPSTTGPLPPQFDESSVPSNPDVQVLEPPQSTGRGVQPSNQMTELYVPPALEVTDEDIERFLESIESNQHYAERFVKGGLDVVFRSKSGVEFDFQRSCLGRMMEEREIRTIPDYHEVMARLNLFLQLDQLNGKKMPKPAIPLRPWKAADLNIDAQYWASPFATFTEPLKFVLHGLMVQFENKVFEIEKRVIDPKYTGPGGRS